MPTNASDTTMVSIKNPDSKPLGELKIKIVNDGVSREIPALSKHWVTKRCYLHYIVPQLYADDGSEITGAKEEWLELVDHMIQDLKWLLSLPHHKFWSHIIYEPLIMNMLVSVLQESPPFYALENFPNITAMKDALNMLQQLVLLVFVRLITNNESPTEYMRPDMQGNLLYDNYIFTVAVMWDLCQLYGRENEEIVKRIIHAIFEMQPAYKDDLDKSIPFLIQVLRRIEQRFEDCPIPLAGEIVALSERGGASREIEWSMLEDHIIHLLDLSSSVVIFLEIYPPGTHMFHKNDFRTSALSVYENVIPEMYKKLEQMASNDDTVDKYFELQHRLDVIRVELIKLYRVIIFTPIDNIIKNPQSSRQTEIKEQIDTYLGALLDALSEQEFISDYNLMFPIDVDFTVISEIYPEFDSMKCNFILESLCALSSNTEPGNYDKNKPDPTCFRPAENHNFDNVPGPSNSGNDQPSTSRDFIDKTSNDVDVELDSLISNVKDILPHLGEGFIQKCLEHYNNDSASVINAVLEDSLPSEIKELDTELPRIPPDPMQASVAVDLALGTQRLNVFDNDEFDVMTRDHIDTTRVHKGKRKDKHKDLNELLNDKSYKESLSNVYSKYSLVTDNDYEDEYDDTYESHDVGPSTRDEPTEMDARPFTIPRVLQSRNKSDHVVEDEEDEEDDGDRNTTNNANFVQDPALLRAKAEQRRLAKKGVQGPKRPIATQERDVVGQPKGQGQDKQVVINRANKNTNKSSRANHHRRSGAEWKRKQGMVPS